MKTTITDLSRRTIEMMYVETLLLADEAQDAFGGERATNQQMDAHKRLLLAVESVRVTTRLMHVTAWLIGQRAIARGDDPVGLERHLGLMPRSDLARVDTLPDDARVVIHASMDLAERAAALETALLQTDVDGEGPAKRLLGRLTGAGYGTT